jgi:hypothetical protein
MQRMQRNSYKKGKGRKGSKTDKKGKLLSIP